MCYSPRYIASGILMGFKCLNDLKLVQNPAKSFMFYMVNGNYLHGIMSLYEFRIYVICYEVSFWRNPVSLQLQFCCYQRM